MSFSFYESYEHLTIYLPFIIHSNHHKVRAFNVPCQKHNKLLQLSLKQRTLHTVGSNKSACIRFL